MSTLSERLKKARMAKGISQEKLAVRVGTVQQIIQKLETGKTRSSEYIQKIAEVLDVDPGWIQFGVGIDPTMSEVYRLIPKGQIAIIEWENVFSWVDPSLNLIIQKLEYISNPRPNKTPREVFALRIKNNAMIGTHNRFDIGTIIIVDYTEIENIKNGDYVVGQFSGTTEAIFRQYFSEAGKEYLSALNPSFEKIHITDNIEFEPLGVLIEHRSINLKK